MTSSPIPARTQLLAVVLGTVAFCLGYFLDGFIPVLDTRLALDVFVQFYREWRFTGRFPGWLELGQFGFPSHTIEWFLIGAPQTIFMMIGRILDVSDAVTLFKCALVLEMIVLATGAWWFAGQWTSADRVGSCLRIGFALWLAGSTPWMTGSNFSFHFISGLPWLLGFVTRWLNRPSALGFAGILFSALAYAWGNISYFVPAIALAVLVYSFVYWVITRKSDLRMSTRSGLPVRVGGYVLALVGLIGAGAYVWVATHAVEGMTFGPSGRDPVTGKVDLVIFLTHGGEISAGRFHEALTGIRPFREAPLFLGVFVALGVVLQIFFVRSAVGLSVLGSAAVLHLLSQGGLTADALYRIFAPIAFYRHLGFLPCMTKVFLGIAAFSAWSQLFAREDLRARVQVWASAFAHRRWIGIAVLAFVAWSIWDFTVSEMLHRFFSETGCKEPILRKCGLNPWTISTALLLFQLMAPVVAIALLLLGLNQSGTVRSGLLASWILAEVSLLSLSTLVQFPRDRVRASAFKEVYQQAMEAPSHLGLRRTDVSVESEVGKNFLVRHAYDFGGHWIEGAQYAWQYGTHGLDPCLPRGRADFWPRGISQVLKARGAKETIYPDGKVTDPWLAAALGCTADRARWVTSASPASTQPAQSAIELSSSQPTLEHVWMQVAPEKIRVQQQPRSLKIERPALGRQIATVGPSQGDAWIYWSIPYAEGWRWIDEAGSVSQPVIANGGFMATPVSAGAGTYRLEYVDQTQVGRATALMRAVATVVVLAWLAWMIMQLISRSNEPKQA